MAILRYLGRKLGYMAESTEDDFKQEFIIECFNDFEQDGSVFFAMEEEPIDEEKQEKWRKCLTTLCDRVGAVIDREKGQWFTGDKLCIADFLIYSHLASFINNGSSKQQKMCDIALEVVGQNKQMGDWHYAII